MSARLVYSYAPYLVNQQSVKQLNSFKPCKSSKLRSSHFSQFERLLEFLIFKKVSTLHSVSTCLSAMLIISMSPRGLHLKGCWPLLKKIGGPALCNSLSGVWAVGSPSDELCGVEWVNEPRNTQPSNTAVTSNMENIFWLQDIDA